MDPDKIFLLCFQENFHDLPAAIYIDSPKMGPMDVSCEHSVFLSYGAGADPRPSARNGFVHTYYTSFHITFVMGRAHS